MNIRASIIDQQLIGIEEQLKTQAKSQLGISGESLKSLAFVYLCVKTILDLEPDEAFDCLTEGGGDFGVDAIHVAQPTDKDLVVTLFQGKYKRTLDNRSTFPENGIEKLISACSFLFDPTAELHHINPALEAKVEDIRSLVRDGAIPTIRVIACNNGLKWNAAAQERIERFGNSDQVYWEHVNHDTLVHIHQQTRPVEETVSLAGKAVFEDLYYNRVCVGRIAVSEIVRLMKAYGDRILERNICNYLGLHGNRVNEDIRNTLLSDTPSSFYFYNNGLTVICDDFSYNGLQSGDYKVVLKNLQIVNGAQTCMTIMKTFDELQLKGKSLPEEAFVLIRIYKLLHSDYETIASITHATNSQNPVDLKDLHGSDQIQTMLEQSIQLLGYSYRRRRTEHPVKQNEMTSGTAAQAVLAVWRQAPHQAKFYSSEHFGKLYHIIFTEDLNGTQVVLAVLLYRFTENRRRRPLDTDPNLVRYASCFLAMLMGKQLLQDMGLKLVQELDYHHFDQAKELIQKNENIYFDQAVKELEEALSKLYGNDWNEKISMQQLSATFRRGDLISWLNVPHSS